MALPATLSERPKAIPLTIGYYLLFVALGATDVILVTTLPTLEENTGVSTSLIGLLPMARSFGFMLGALLMGYLYDRFAGHRVLSAATLGIVALLILVPSFDLYGLLLVLFFFTGMAASGIDIGGNTLIIWVHGARVAPYMNGLHLFFGVGAFIAPLIVGLTAFGASGLRASYWLLALLILPAALWILTLKSPRQADKPHNDNDPDPDAPVNYRTLGMIAFFLLLMVGIEAGFASWITTYLVRREVADAQGAAYIASGFWAAFTFGRVLAIPLSLWFTPRNLLLFDLLGCLMGSILMLLTANITLLWVGILLMGVSMASLFPTTLNFAERRLTISGRVNSWFFFAASLAGISIPPLIGLLIDRIDPQAMMVVIGLNTLIGLVMLAIMVRFTASDAATQPKF